MSGIKSIDKLKSVLADKYEIVGLIASGGMGEIYLGIHRVLGKKRAIKVIHQEVEKEKDIRQRFMLEARLAASIDHPGIIQIMDFGSHDSFDYLIMPYIEGVTLQDRMDDGVMKWEEAIDLMISMAEAISHAHQKDVIHRDIKPANYMIDVNGQVILTDFGISKNLTDVTLTAANTILGSPKFMSPEQIIGKKVDKRSDLYSLGLVFYQMLTGLNPFDAEELTAVMYKQVHEVPDHPCTINQHIPKKLGDIIFRLMEKKPEDRYPDAEMLLVDLQNLDQSDFFDGLDDDGGRTVLQVPRAHDRPKRGLPKQAQSTPAPVEPDVSRPGSGDMATQIISPGERKELKDNEKADALKSSKKKKSNKIKFFTIVGIFIFSLVAVIYVFVPELLKINHKKRPATVPETSQVEMPLVTEDLSVEVTPDEPEDTHSIPEMQTPETLLVKVSDIRVDPQIISETLEKDKFVIKTIRVSNDGAAKLSELKIQTESDGAFDFLGPVNNRSFDVDAGSEVSFTCPVNSANTTPGELKTGRIKIFSNDPDENPKIIEVKLTVKETTAAASGDKMTRVSKPGKPLIAVRPKSMRESAFLRNYEKLKGRRISGQDLRNLLKLNIGIAYEKSANKLLMDSMKKQLASLSFVQLQEKQPCDILISYDNTPPEKFVVKSNFFDCGKDCPGVKINNEIRRSLDELDAMLKRYYCYHAFMGLTLVNVNLGGARIDIEIPGKTGNVLFVDDEVKLCMTPELASDCMLFDINIAGVYKLFPIFEDQKIQQVPGETQCSIEIKVAPPVGYEMVVALGVKNKKLISKFRNRFDPEAPIVLWLYSGDPVNSAMIFSEELFVNLINEPIKDWCIGSRFIKIIHSN